MSGTKVALLVGCSDYENPEKFPPLPARQNVEALARVLADPAIGGFRVETLLDQRSDKVSEQIESFFVNHKPDDLLLLYFSCHGVLDPTDCLYFVAANTRRELLGATANSAQWVEQQMRNSCSQRIVLLLDCCYSGAFGGLTRGSASAKKIVEQLGGRGRVIITASDKLEPAHDSEFTDAVVGGLGTGAADRDGDGLVSVYELYQYVHDRVRVNRPNQTPTWSANVIGELYLAKNPHVPLPLPDDLDQALRSETVWQRRGAIDGLERLLAGDHPGGQKRAARQALDRLAGVDPDPDIRRAAEEALGRLQPPPPNPPPPPSEKDRRLPGRWPAKVVATVVLGVLLLSSVVTYAVLTDKPATDTPAVAKPVPCPPIARPGNGVLSLGTLLPRTGQFTYSGPAQDAGVRLAMKDINDAGGIPGIAVTLDEANQRDEGDPSGDTAGQSTDALLANEVDVIIGPATSEVATKVIDKAVCAGAIMFAPSNTSPRFTTYPDHGLYFRTAPLSVLEGLVLGELVVRKDGNSTAVVMSRDDEFGNALREETVKAIQKFGGQVLDSFSYDPNTGEYDKEIQRVKAEDPAAIVLIGYAETSRILASMIDEGLGPRSKGVYLPGAFVTNTLVSQVRQRDPGVLAGVKGTPLDTGGDEFTKRLREANPGLRDLIYAPQTYDAVVITALAAAIAGTDEPAAIAREINGVTKTGEQCTSFAACMALVRDRKDIDYDGPSGPLEFAEPGEPRSATYVISEIQADGSVKSLESVRVGS